jgi:hypothetical protein
VEDMNADFPARKAQFDQQLAPIERDLQTLSQLSSRCVCGGQCDRARSDTLHLIH